MEKKIYKLRLIMARIRYFFLYTVVYHVSKEVSALGQFLLMICYICQLPMIKGFQKRWNTINFDVH